MSRTLALTFLIIPLLVVNYALEACIENLDDEELECTGGEVSDLIYHEDQYFRSVFIADMSIPIIDRHTLLSHFRPRQNFITVSCCSCEIEIIEPKAFTDFLSLHALKLPNNRLGALNSSWLREINRIKILDLTNNTIEYIEDKAFDYLRNLRQLYLESNKIKQLKFDMINHMVKLNRLTLSENPLNSLNDIFKFFRDHLSLTMYWSIINETCSAFKDDYGYVLEYQCTTGNILDFTNDPGKVEKITVCGMSIPLLTNETFSGFNNNLLKLGCRYCEIEHIQPNAFSRFPNLTHLRLPGNQLTTVEASYLRGLEGLKILNLNNNQIKSIDDNVYDHLREVTTINLNGNKLECLNDTAMAPMKKLRRLNLRNNPYFDCTSLVSKFMKSNRRKTLVRFSWP